MSNIVPSARMTVSGARGESYADVARRVGSIAGIPVPPTATDAQVMDIMTSAFGEVVAAASYTVIDPVRANSTGNVTLTDPGTDTFDGVTLDDGDRLLLSGQTDAAENGIYVFNGASSALTRAADFDESSEVVHGSLVNVMEGEQAGSWVLVTPGPITVGTTDQTWRPFSLRSAAKITTGSGRSIQDRLDDMSVFAADYGVVGDGIVDDTAACQMACDAGAALGKSIYFGSMRPKITYPGIVSIRDIIFDVVGFDSNAPGFIATFADDDEVRERYVAVKRYAFGGQDRFAVNGVGDQVPNEGSTAIVSDTRELIDGVWFGDMWDGDTDPPRPYLASKGGSVRAHNLKGNGIRILAAYDSGWDILSVEKCGSDDDYAWVIGTAGLSDVIGDGPYNWQEGTIDQLQVEQCFGKAVWTDPGCLSCHITKIHSERYIPANDDGSEIGWAFGGQISMGSVRLQSYVACKARFETEYCTIGTLSSEGPRVQLGPTIGAPLTITQFSGGMEPVPNQVGHIIVLGGNFSAYNLTGGRWRIYNANIAELTIGDTNGQMDDTIGVFSSMVSNLGSSAGVASAMFSTCIVSGELLPTRTILRNGSQFTSDGGGETINVKRVDLYDSDLVGNYVLNNAAIHMNGRSRVLGDVEVQTQGGLLMSMRSVVTGDVTGWAAPDQNAYTGTFYPGDTVKHPKPTEGGVAAYVRTTSNTWKSIGLAA